MTMLELDISGSRWPDKVLSYDRLHLPSHNRKEDT
jgi:hypothetical protein